MLSTDRLSVLRERNKDLLKQLRQQTERLQLLSCTQSRTECEAEAREDGNPAEMETLTDRNPAKMETLTDGNPAEMETLTDGNCGPARAALNKPTVSFAESETFEIHSEAQSRDTRKRLIISAPPSTSKHRGGTADHTLSSELFKGGSRSHVVRNRPQDARKPGSKARGKELRKVGSGVTFQSNEWEEMSASNRHRLQPLLGYDWIAGILDVESSLIERSEEFFNDLRMFRSVNKDECVHSQQAGFSEENYSVPPLLADEDGPEADMDPHQCTFSYRINSRLFPIPLHSQECCPVCKKPKSAHPHTPAEPASIRVSIPRSTLLPAYKHKAHRRCSFDPSDSLGLPSHCLSGWSNTGQSSLSQPSSLDLQSSLNTKTSTRLIVAQSQNKEQLDLSVSRVSGNQRSGQILNVSRLARHHFQHLSPRKQRCTSSYPVY